MAGIAPFLLVWVIPDEQKDDFSRITDLIVIPKEGHNVPVLSMVPVTTFLLLTWILLTVEIEGTSIEAHEYYGAPLVSLLALGLALYAWGDRVSGRAGVIALFGDLDPLSGSSLSLRGWIYLGIRTEQSPIVQGPSPCSS